MPSLKAQLGDLGWDLDENIDQGGQARIYLVRRKGGDNEELFAAKLLKNTESQSAYERFYREIESVKRVRHPGVVAIEDHSRPDADLHYYVMRYTEGTISLKRVIGSEDNPFFGNALKSLAFFESLMEAIKACESQKVVHRDLSPGNVLLLPDGRPLLIDFGCCWIEDGAHLRSRTRMLGRPTIVHPNARHTAELCRRPGLISIRPENCFGPS
jgi:serine/threonine-protein kinase